MFEIHEILKQTAINKKVMPSELIGLIFGGISMRDTTCSTQIYPEVRT